MTLNIWKSLKRLDVIKHDDNVVKLWSRFIGKYLLINTKSSCQTDVDIRVMSLHEEVRRIYIGPQLMSERKFNGTISLAQPFARLQG